MKGYSLTLPERDSACQIKIKPLDKKSISAKFPSVDCMPERSSVVSLSRNIPQANHMIFLIHNQP